MAKVTIVFGVLLMVLAGIGFAATHMPHALIPGAFGLILVLCGLMANTEDAKRRALWMHIAVTVGLLGFLGTAMSIPRIVQMAGGTTIANPIGAEDQFATCILCLIFVVLCVRSFISARRARLS